MINSIWLLWSHRHVCRSRQETGRLRDIGNFWTSEAHPRVSVTSEPTGGQYGWQAQGSQWCQGSARGGRQEIRNRWVPFQRHIMLQVWWVTAGCYTWIFGRHLQPWSNPRVSFHGRWLSATTPSLLWSVKWTDNGENWATVLYRCLWNIP